MSNYSNKIAITTGDPNGIGAEITIKALNLLNLPTKDIVIISNSKVLNTYGQINNNYEIIELDYSQKVIPGEGSASAGDFAYRALEKACDIKPKFIVTAPTSKEAMHLAGHKFNGQTEILEKQLAHDRQKAEMLFVSKDFRILLLTRHCALKDVSNLLTKDVIVEKVERLRSYFQNKLLIKKPSFALCALNPHAGEDGHLGMEEIDTIIPTFEELKAQGINIIGPLPADTMFQQKYIEKADAFLTMYHDQGLPVLKYAGFDCGYNTTLGLPYIRTSVDHGTALDLAGTTKADPGSLFAAVELAHTMALRSRR